MVYPYLAVFPVDAFLAERVPVALLAHVALPVMVACDLEFPGAPVVEKLEPISEHLGRLFAVTASADWLGYSVETEYSADAA